MKKLVKDLKKMYRVFTTFNTQIQRLKEADSDLSESEYDDEASNFQIVDINFGKIGSHFYQN